MKSCGHREGWGRLFELWVRVFNLHFSDTMKSCRHKRYRNLILDWFRTGDNDLIGRRRGIQRQGETYRQKSLWLENAARHRNRDVSPDRAHPSRAGNISPILLRSLLQRAASEGSFSYGKKGTKTAKAEARRQRLAPRQPEQVSRLAAPVFQAVDLLSQRAVVIRFAVGGVMEIPEDRVDLVRIAITTIDGYERRKQAKAKSHNESSHPTCHGTR